MMEIGLYHYVILSSIIFCIGIVGIFLNTRNLIVLLLCIELMLLSVSINLVAFSVYQPNIIGQLFTLFILTVAAAETAIGLAILVIYFRHKSSIDINEANELKG